MRWHPDRNGGDKAAEAAFATVAHAHGVLTDPEQREVFDRLGARGLERLRDGDPSVRKDWLPPDEEAAEALRRVHDDGDEPWFQSVVSSSIAYVTGHAVPALRRLAAALAAEPELPSVRITATSDASGAALPSGGSTRGSATFMFALSGLSADFGQGAVTHNCARPRFLGMKSTFYLQCEFVAGREIEIEVAADTFTTATGRQGGNRASARFLLSMV